MNVERLERLEKLLIADAANSGGIRFDLELVGDIGEEAWWRRTLRKERPVLSCRTTGCAMGLAAMSGEFAVEGLGFYVRGGEASGDIGIVLEGKKRSYSDAAAMLFGISERVAGELFNPRYYRERRGADGELAVAARIRSLIETGKTGA